MTRKQEAKFKALITKFLLDGYELPPIGGCKAAYGKTFVEIKYGINEDELIQHGIARYFRDCKKAGLIPVQPSKTHSRVNEHEQLVLSNVNGEIIRYDVIAKGTRLREIRKAA